MPKHLELTRGLTATVDDDVYEEVSQYVWYADRMGNAVRNVVGSDGGRSTEVLHRRLTNAQPGQAVIHLDGDSSNCLRSNLRVVPQGSFRRSLGAREIGNLRGVSYHAGTGRWRALISIDGRSVYLGSYADPQCAALAYDVAALQVRGKKAIINFPLDKLTGGRARLKGSG